MSVRFKLGATTFTINWSTVISAAGLLGLAVYDLAQKDVGGAVTAFLGFLAAIGIPAVKPAPVPPVPTVAN